MKRDVEKFLTRLFDEIKFSPAQRAEARDKFMDNLEEPVKIIGIGQTGVGKTELLRSIFRISEKDLNRLKVHRTDATRSETKNFSHLIISTPEGMKVQFTDGPGLGEDEESDEQYMNAWIAEIPKHDLLYWVLDAASRDVRHIQQNMRRILDATNFRSRFVLVLNKVDNIQLEEDDRSQEPEPWNLRYNQPSKLLLKQIERRITDIINKFERAVGIDKEQIVSCSALKRWNHGAVLDKIIELLPKDKRIKADENRDVKSAVELMDPDVKYRLQSGSE